MDIRRGQTVLITTGKDKGKQGPVEQVIRAKHQVVVTGFNMIKRHLKKSSQHPAGGIIELSAPLDWSKVKLLDDVTQAPTQKAKK